MAQWLDLAVAEQPLLHPGHTACAGCGPAVVVRHVLGALAEATPGRHTILVVPASCWAAISGIWPVNAFGVTVHLTPFASAAAEASGLKAALRLRGRDDVHVVVWGGDGSTFDIGFAGVSAAAERNEDIIYVLNDNEAYMNTGVQKSGGTPEGAWTTTTPSAAPRAGRKKDIDRIMADHGIPYLATMAVGSVPLVKDLRAKVARAATTPGFRFLHALGPCPPGWRYPAAQTVEVARLAVESRTFPLVEVVEGAWSITHRPRAPLPVAGYLSCQGRFSHLTEDTAALIQQHVDERWERLEQLEAGTGRR